MKIGDIIKHHKFMDVCCEILDIKHKITGLAVTVKWLNQGFTKSWILPAKKQSIFIRNGEMNNWSVAQDNPVCLRNAVWRQL